MIAVSSRGSGAVPVSRRRRATEVTHEVWALGGDAGIASRTGQLITEADGEDVLVIGRGGIFTADPADRLAAARARGVDVVVGAVTDELRRHVEDALPAVRVFVSGLEWLGRSEVPGDETEISRLLLGDREALLVGTSAEAPGAGRTHEQAAFGRRFDNGLVAIVPRLMVPVLLDVDDPDSRTQP